MPIPLDPNVTAFQGEWRFCKNCYSLWYNGKSTNGVCPSPEATYGQHNGEGSWNYILPVNPSQQIPGNPSQ
jgi:hypothetical protein